MRALADTRSPVVRALDEGVPLRLLGEDAWPEMRRLFPLCEPERLVRLLDGISAVQVDSVTWRVWYQTPAGLRLSFKAPAALLLLASGVATEPAYTVYTTGNWGRALAWAAEVLDLDLAFDVRRTRRLSLLRRNVLNTDAIAAQWGVMQALSTLPRPTEMRAVRCRVTQGHLRMALEGLGYRVVRTGGVLLLTEVS